MIRSFLFTLLVIGLFPLTASGQFADIEQIRPAGQSGINMFEAPVTDDAEFDGLELSIGGAFAQQLQGITHSGPNLNNDGIGRGFNLATANFDLNARFARGINLHVRTYLSSRHHNEAWVKGGYLQVNELPMFNSSAVDAFMENLSIRAGHFMPNYGDTHYRRSDNADAIQNPFVGNTVVDAFTTEVGAEATYKSNGVLAVGGFGGALHPTVANPDGRAPSWHGKLGYDAQVNDMVRVRLTGSVYYTAKSNDGQLHSGDRAGGRYYNVVGGGDWSGRVRLNYGNETTAFMVNPFVKIGGLELFGTIESISGEGTNLSDGSTTQYAGEALYRFADNDLYVGARYNTMSGDVNLAGYQEPASWSDIGVDRFQLGAGWFMTENILVKGEYVTQTYNDYPNDKAQYDAEFDGFMLEGIISF